MTFQIHTHFYIVTKITPLQMNGLIARVLQFWHRFTSAYTTIRGLFQQGEDSTFSPNIVYVNLRWCSNCRTLLAGCWHCRPTHQGPGRAGCGCCNPREPAASRRDAWGQSAPGPSRSFFTISTNVTAPHTTLQIVYSHSWVKWGFYEGFFTINVVVHITLFFGSWWFGVHCVNKCFIGVQTYHRFQHQPKINVPI